MISFWLHLLAIVSLVCGFAGAIIVAADVMRRPQHMWIMNVVWPVTALFGTVFALWFYFRFGRTAAHKSHNNDEAMPPFPVVVAKGAMHCGSGCTLGDICAEWLAVFVPAVAIWLGWQTVFAEKMFAVWILDFIFAFAFGIVFQYFSIAPMRGLSFWPGIVAALKADTLSLISWQVGMYGAMAIAQFLIFRPLLGVTLDVASVEFWFVMQIAMIAGFITAYPVNWWLIEIGIKEPM